MRKQCFPTLLLCGKGLCINWRSHDIYLNKYLKFLKNHGGTAVELKKITEQLAANKKADEKRLKNYLTEDKIKALQPPLLQCYQMEQAYEVFKNYNDTDSVDAEGLRQYIRGAIRPRKVSSLIFDEILPVFGALAIWAFTVAARERDPGRVRINLSDIETIAQPVDRFGKLLPLLDRLAALRALHLLVGNRFFYHLLGHGTSHLMEPWLIHQGKAYSNLVWRRIVQIGVAPSSRQSLCIQKSGRNGGCAPGSAQPHASFHSPIDPGTDILPSCRGPR